MGLYVILPLDEIRDGEIIEERPFEKAASVKSSGYSDVTFHSSDEGQRREGERIEKRKPKRKIFVGLSGS